MASSIDFVNFVLEQLEGVGNLRFRKMFGEYCVYINEKPIILICDDTAYIAKDKSIENLMLDAGTGYPYEGAKERYILDIENGDFAREVVRKLEQVTPMPKSKGAKK